MSPFQTFFLCLSLAVFAFAWLRGGHTERAGVAMFLVNYIVSLFAQYVTLNAFRLGEAVVDGVFFVAIVWLALRRDRWWTLAAAAFAALTMVAHAIMFLTPDLTTAHIRMDIGARWGIGGLMVLCLAGGVLERWLAGEEPVSPNAVWRRRDRLPS